MAYWKEIIESGVRVKPRSLNMDVEVNTPLYGFALSFSADRGETLCTHHHALLMASPYNTELYVPVVTIHATKHTIPRMWKPI